MSKAKETKVCIIGGGLVGSLLSVYLSRQKFSVSLYEKRPDPRTVPSAEGRSINLALSHRGLRALKEIGLEESIRRIAIPMKGRVIHKENGELNFLPYGEKGQYINSISRNQLNELLIGKAEQNAVQLQFGCHCDSLEPESGKILFSQNEKKISIEPDLIFGADGAFSEVRNAFKKFPDFTFQQEFLSHGYKELHIPPDSEGKHLIEKNALHIWPREQFMLIALPNTDGSFTATLFLPFTGTNSFERIKSGTDAEAFFRTHFPDALPIIPELKKDFFLLPPSSLVTVHCFPWVYKDKVALIGDAAHAITPFYGQGMNAGFEDCRILNSMIENEAHDWEKIFSRYQSERKKNADAIAELALQNFIEMRDLVGDEQFVLRKKIEAKIHQKHPSWLPLYSMVTFSDIPYHEALLKGKEHDRMMEKIMQVNNIERLWETEEGWREIEKIIVEQKRTE